MEVGQIYYSKLKGKKFNVFHKITAIDGDMVTIDHYGEGTDEFESRFTKKEINSLVRSRIYLPDNKQRSSQGKKVPSDMERKRDEEIQLTGKYAKLSDDLRKAAEIGRKVASQTIDDGTCNVDSVALYLKGWRHDNVEAAAKQAGFGCSDWTPWKKKLYTFQLGGCGKANARSAAAHAMYKFLAEAGYDATEYCQAD